MPRESASAAAFRDRVSGRRGGGDDAVEFFRSEGRAISDAESGVASPHRRKV